MLTRTQVLILAEAAEASLVSAKVAKVIKQGKRRCRCEYVYKASSLGTAVCNGPLGKVFSNLWRYSHIKCELEAIYSKPKAAGANLVSQSELVTWLVKPKKAPFSL
jgi:hypothetical protein